MARTRSSRVLAVLATAGVVLLTVGAVLLVVGFSTDGRGVRVLGIVAAVLGLACLRACFWARKARLLGEVARDLHVPHED